MTVDDIEDHFSEGESNFANFECPKCETEWGISNWGDPPGEMEETVKCTCGAVLEIFGEWTSSYSLDVELIDNDD